MADIIFICSIIISLTALWFVLSVIDVIAVKNGKQLSEYDESPVGHLLVSSTFLIMEILPFVITML